MHRERTREKKPNRSFPANFHRTNRCLFSEQARERFHRSFFELITFCRSYFDRQVTLLAYSRTSASRFYFPLSFFPLFFLCELSILCVFTFFSPFFPFSFFFSLRIVKFLRHRIESRDDFLVKCTNKSLSQVLFFHFNVFDGNFMLQSLVLVLKIEKCNSSKIIDNYHESI